MRATIHEDTPVGKLQYRIAVTAFAAVHDSQPNRDALSKELQQLLKELFDKALFQRFVDTGKRYRALFEDNLHSLRCLACIPDEVSRTT